MVQEWDWCYRLFGKCPLRTGTVNDCFPLSTTAGAKYPAGTEKILIDFDFLTYYLNMLNGPWEASQELICYPKYMTYRGSTLITGSSVSVFVMPFHFVNLKNLYSKKWKKGFVIKWQKIMAHFKYKSTWIFSIQQACLNPHGFENLMTSLFTNAIIIKNCLQVEIWQVSLFFLFPHFWSTSA